MPAYYLIAIIPFVLALFMISYERKRDKYKQEVLYPQFLQAKLHFLKYMSDEVKDKESQLYKDIKKEIAKTYIELIFPPKS